MSRARTISAHSPARASGTGRWRATRTTTTTRTTCTRPAARAAPAPARVLAARTARARRPLLAYPFHLRDEPVVLRLVQLLRREQLVVLVALAPVEVPLPRKLLVRSHVVEVEEYPLGAGVEVRRGLHDVPPVLHVREPVEDAELPDQAHEATEAHHVRVEARAALGGLELLDELVELLLASLRARRLGQRRNYLVQHLVGLEEHGVAVAQHDAGDVQRREQFRGGHVIRGRADALRDGVEVLHRQGRVPLVYQAVQLPLQVAHGVEREEIPGCALVGVGDVRGLGRAGQAPKREGAAVGLGRGARDGREGRRGRGEAARARGRGGEGSALRRT
mmetsp:Transcript_23454/g.79841  ORF Transcript_23454/g.79841 Transcript_23454/m.79841 type:complete len:334 (+) Transcript_23454:625-1626(+)